MNYNAIASRAAVILFVFELYQQRWWQALITFLVYLWFDLRSKHSRSILPTEPADE